MKKIREVMWILLVALVACNLSVAHGLAEEKEENGKTQFTFSAAGDCTFSSDIKQPSGVNFFRKYRQKGANYFFKKVRQVFEKDDLTIVNFEGTLSKRGHREDKKWAFRGRPKYVKILKKGSVEAVSLANNHIRDYGKVSYKDTRRILTKNGIPYSSATKYSIKTVNGIKVGMVSVCSIQGYYSPISALRRTMKKLKKKHPDVIIASMHSGIEHTQKINSSQKAIAKKAIDLGADVVLGHHPHVIQGIDTYKGKYIVYSLGNFVFGGNTNPSDKDTFIFQQTYQKDENGKVKVKQSKVIPCRLSGTNSVNNYQPVICGDKGKRRVIRRLNAYSKPFHVKIGGDGILHKK